MHTGQGLEPYFSVFFARFQDSSPEFSVSQHPLTAPSAWRARTGRWVASVPIAGVSLCGGPGGLRASWPRRQRPPRASSSLRGAPASTGLTFDGLRETQFADGNCLATCMSYAEAPLVARMSCHSLSAIAGRGSSRLACTLARTHLSYSAARVKACARSGRVRRCALASSGCQRSR